MRGTGRALGADALHEQQILDRRGGGGVDLPASDRPGQERDNALADRTQVVQHVGAERDLASELLAHGLISRATIVLDEKVACSSDKHRVEIGISGSGFDRLTFDRRRR